MQFKNWYRSLPSNKIMEFRDTIIKKCGITKPIFYNWLNGITDVPKLAQDVIIEISGEQVLFEQISVTEPAPQHPQD